MKLSRESQYGLEALSLLAEVGPGRVMVLKDIAAARSLPTGFVATIFQKLARHNLVSSHRGAVRGYALARPPHEITLRQIVEAIEGPDLFERCIFWSGRCGDQDPCRLHERWATVRPQVRAMMDATTLGELVLHGPKALRAGGEGRGR